jgi:hypothetical protein
LKKRGEKLLLIWAVAVGAGSVTVKRRARRVRDDIEHGGRLVAGREAGCAYT